LTGILPACLENNGSKVRGSGIRLGFSPERKEVPSITTL